ncbi:MAG: histidine kinase dimerization/phospho-acceptor domain-containing protein, partial [Anaerolineales bacterium]
MKTFSLRWRIVLIYTVLLILIMGGLNLYLANFVRNAYLTIYRQRLVSEANLLAQQILPLVARGSPYSDLDEIVHTTSQAASIRITVILPDGRVIAESNANAFEMENHRDRPEIQQALEGEIGSAIRHSYTIFSDLLYVALPVYQHNQILFILRLAIPLDELEMGIIPISRGILIATILATIMAIVLASALTSYLIAPINQLAQNLRLSLKNKIDSPVFLQKLDEVSELKLAFDELMRQINQQIQELMIERGTLSAILSQMTDGVLIVNEEGIVELINPAAISMFKVENLTPVMCTMVEIVRHHEIIDAWQKSRINQIQQTLTLEITPDRLFIQIVIIPLKENLRGKTLLICQDLTRIHRLETIRQDFVSNVSHELRTPLASLKAITETLLEGALDDPPAARRFLTRMEDEIDNLVQMVRELLELSRIETGRIPLNFQHVSPCELIHSVVERMRIQAERAGVNLASECPPDLSYVKADADRVEQVLVNLVHNAIKFTLPGGQILVSAYPSKNEVIFFVRDTGVGIPPEDLQR